ncbi:hypothetical protein BPAE_0036g00020 [Botrytis paeoniae]|uniref:Nephrocystin 3-like N-terminal domain-containing protein n=1 Tax=Botrytis paeoniae TaxID=278948 RepID=A0A4Z1G1A5_9HELO|nr:hypothetical protein BPAE_0036g00020 [Botrytis paeoniae]
MSSGKSINLGTGILVCDTPQCQQWHNIDDHGSLWVKGVPGAGKSVIPACLVRHLKATENSPVLFNNLATFRLQFVKTLMTSRPIQPLQLGLKDASIVQISLEDDRVGKDIDLFVSQRLGNMLEGRNSDLKLSLHSIICDRSAGLFLYARLLSDQLVPALVSKQHLDLEETDSTLPVGMQDMYNSILLQQSKSIGIDTDRQVFTLDAVIFFSRLLRLNELADLLAFIYPSYNLSSAKTIVKSACDTGGRTLLHWACQSDHFKIVELLLHYRAILDNEDDSHLRPIHEAARRKSAPIVLALLKAGVNPTRSTDDDSRPDSEVCARYREGEPGTALDYMCANGHTETIFVTVPFLETRGIEEALWRCLMNGKPEAVRAILTNTNVSLNAVYTGTTILYAATIGEDPGSVEQVLIRDADLNVFSEPRLLDRRQHSAKPQDRDIFRAQHYTILQKDGQWAYSSLVVFYITYKRRKVGHPMVPERRVQCDDKDEKGHGSIYNILARTKDVELLKLLIHHGADVSAISTDGESCLEALFAYRFTTRDTDSFDTTIQFLVKNGARCDVQPAKGLSIIERMANSKNYNIKTFRFMLQYCTDKETKRRCLLLLNKDTKEEMKKFDEEILLSGVSLKERDEKGRTALIQKD